MQVQLKEKLVSLISVIVANCCIDTPVRKQHRNTLKVLKGIQAQVLRFETERNQDQVEVVMASVRLIGSSQAAGNS